MEIVRKVVNGTDLQNVIDLPKSLINKKVEVIVFPVEESNNKKNKKSLLGILSKYANPELAINEETAWYEGAKE